MNTVTKNTSFPLFKNLSIFQGIIEFFDGSKMFRAEAIGFGIYKIYIEEGTSWIYSCTVKSKKSCKALYNAYCAIEDWRSSNNCDNESEVY
jgi:hypothetical protein